MIKEKAVAPHSSTLAWKIPWTEEPGGLQSMGSLSRTQLSDFTFTFHFVHRRRKWQPTPAFLPGESQGWGSLAGCCLWGRTESTRLKRLSSSSSIINILYLETSSAPAYIWTTYFNFWFSANVAPFSYHILCCTQCGYPIISCFFSCKDNNTHNFLCIITFLLLWWNLSNNRRHRSNLTSPVKPSKIPLS